MQVGDPLFSFESDPIPVDDAPDRSWSSVESARRALIDRSIGYRSGDEVIERDYILYRDTDGQIRAAGFADDARVLRPGAWIHTLCNPGGLRRKLMDLGLPLSAAS